MKKDLIKKIEIPENVEVEIAGTQVKVKGPEGENIKEFKIRKIKLEKKEKEIIISSKNATKNEKKIMNSINAHLNNMIRGVQEKFNYKMKICYNHFPITVEIKDKEAIIKNFLGEKIARRAKILDGVEVKINKDFVEINSTNREAAGQTAGNFEKATWIRMRDRRIFQDGIFITNKPRREEE